VCGSFWVVEKTQNGSRYHGNQGAKNVKFTLLNFINMPKASTHYGEYSYDVS
jgi:hypothetical protein